MNKGIAFQTILVGVDGTPEAENAALVATSLANNLQARMILLGVLAPMNPESQAEGVGLEKAADERLRLEEQLQTMLAAARECGVDVVAEIAEGDPGKEIERRAEHGLVDLIVVGHRRNFCRASFGRELQDEVDLKLAFSPATIASRAIPC